MKTASEHKIEYTDEDLSLCVPFEFAGNGRHVTLASCYFNVENHNDDRKIVIKKNPNFSKTRGGETPAGCKRLGEILQKCVLPFKASILVGDAVFISMDAFELLTNDRRPQKVICVSTDPFALCLMRQSVKKERCIDGQLFNRVTFHDDRYGDPHIKCLVDGDNPTVEDVRSAFNDFDKRMPEYIAWFNVAERFGLPGWRAKKIGRSTKSEYACRMTLAGVEAMKKCIAAGDWKRLKWPFYPPFSRLQGKALFYVRCIMDSIFEGTFPAISYAPRNQFSVNLGNWIPNCTMDHWASWARPKVKHDCVFYIRSYAFEGDMATRNLLLRPFPLFAPDLGCECGELREGETMVDHMSVCKLGFMLIECGCGTLFRLDGWDRYEHSIKCRHWKLRHVVEKPTPVL